MTAYLLSYGVPALLAVVAGALAGGLTAWKLLRRPEPAAAPVTAEPESEPDTFTEPEIDIAAVRWQEANNQPPEAAGLLAARLKTLHRIGQQKGWF